MSTSKPKSRFDEVALRHCSAYANILQEAVSGPFRPDAVYKIDSTTTFPIALKAGIDGLKHSTPTIPAPDQDDFNVLLKLCNSGYLKFLEVGNRRTNNGLRGDPVAVATKLYNRVIGNKATGGFELGGRLTAFKRPAATTTPGVAKTPGPNSADPANKAGKGGLEGSIATGNKEILNTLDKSAPTVTTR